MNREKLEEFQETVDSLRGGLDALQILLDEEKTRLETASRPPARMDMSEMA